MKADKAKKLARNGELNEAWIGYGEGQTVFAKKAKWSEVTGRLLVETLAGDIVKILPESITSIRH